jgi:hypothetical protein
MTVNSSIIPKSLHKFYAIPKPTSLVIPQIHQLKLVRPINVMDKSIYIALDSNFTPISGNYTDSSKYPLYANTYLYFYDGASYHQIEILDNNGLPNDITITATEVPINRSTVAIPVTATAKSYLAVLCNGIQADSTSNVLNIRGDHTTEDSHSYWNIIHAIGSQLGYVFFAKDYYCRFHEIGIVQLTKPSTTTGGINLQGQIQSLNRWNENPPLSDIDIIIDERRYWGMDLR